MWLTISAIVFAVMAVAVRLAGIHDITGSQATLARFLFGLATVAVAHASGTARVRLRRLPLLIARGITGGVAILFYFLSLTAAKGEGAVPLTNSVFLGNSYFIYAPLFGAIFLHERLRISTVLMVAAALVGLYLVAQPDFSNLRAGNVYGFASGLMAGLTIVTIRELRRTEEPISIFFSLSVFGILASLIFLAAEKFVWPDPMGWFLLVIIGITSTIGQLSMTYAMRFARAGEGSIIAMTTVIYSSIAGVLWFGDPFNLKIAIGAVIVIGSAAYISLVQEQEVVCE